MKTLYFITSNKSKFLEAQEKLKILNIKLVQKNLGYPEIQANTLKEVTRFGVAYIQKKFSHPFIIEDAGLFIDILKGFPGVYSSYIYHTIGCKGVLKLLEGTEIGRTAMFRSVYGYKKPDKKPVFFIGECHGTISREEKGESGFGYDPIFVPDGKARTFAQMTVVEKNNYSHRGMALEKFIDFTTLL
jgi:XTP/dITP diphosphohydrolase